MPLAAAGSRSTPACRIQRAVWHSDASTSHEPPSVVCRSSAASVPTAARQPVV
jgi:hypothetical protein